MREWIYGKLKRKVKFKVLRLLIDKYAFYILSYNFFKKVYVVNFTYYVKCVII